MNLQELKAQAYDLIAEKEHYIRLINKLNEELNIVNKKIDTIIQEEKKP